MIKKLVDDAIRKLVRDELQKNIVIGGDMIMTRRTSEVVGFQIDCTC